MKKKKYASSVLALVLCGALLLSGCGGGKQGAENDGGSANSGTIRLRLSSDSPIDHMSTILNQEACEMVKERTEGRVEIQLFPASQLGSYESVYEEIVRGTIDISQAAVPDSLDSRLGASYLPYYATSFEEAKILYGPDSYMTEMFGEVTQSTGVRFLGFVLEGFIAMGVVKEPTDVMTPGTPKGIKIRAASTATFRYPLEDLGYDAITITYSEVPTAIQTKVVDGWVGGTPNINYAWLGEVIKKVYINYIHAEATSYIISEKSLAKLTPEDQQIVIDVFAEQSAKSFEVSEENEELYKQKLAEKGVEIIELTPDELKANMDFVRDKTWTRLEENLTPEAIARFREEVAKLQ